eukprot:2158912-Pyramimonas_sp.AAC.1
MAAHFTVVDAKRKLAFCRCVSTLVDTKSSSYVLQRQQLSSSSETTHLIPKNANELLTGIFRWANGASDWDDPKMTHLAYRQQAGLDHLDYRRFASLKKNYLSGKDHSLFKFVFVRNPFDRLVSGYISKFIGRNPETDRTGRQLHFDFNLRLNPPPLQDNNTNFVLFSITVGPYPDPDPDPSPNTALFTVAGWVW